MSILVHEKTRVLVQGITGNEGSRATSEMLKYGTKVLAGVTPGKGGQTVYGVPVYNTIKEALNKHSEINSSLISVPATAVRAAAFEAIQAKIPLITILTEHVPTYESALLVHEATKRNLRIIGPSSVGIISPGKGKMGSIGSSEIQRVFTPGPIGLISKSGGMTAEIASILTRSGFGQSTVVGIGGDMILGTDFVDLLKEYETDSETKAVVIFGEIGGTYEEQAAEYVNSGEFTKPLVAMVAGRFTEQLPQDTVLGHAGAIVSNGQGNFTSKVTALKNAGALLAERLEEIPILIKKALYEQMDN